jgi:hypothetical protein
VNGRVLGGANAIAGEWGHNPLPLPDDDDVPLPACYCGRAGCIETYLSGPGMAADHARHNGAALMPEAIVAAPQPAMPPAKPPCSVTRRAWPGAGRGDQPPRSGRDRAGRGSRTWRVCMPRCRSAGAPMSFRIRWIPAWSAPSIGDSSGVRSRLAVAGGLRQSAAIGAECRARGCDSFPGRMKSPLRTPPRLPMDLHIDTFIVRPCAPCHGKAGARTCAAAGVRHCPDGGAACCPVRHRRRLRRESFMPDDPACRCPGPAHPTETLSPCGPRRILPAAPASA